MLLGVAILIEVADRQFDEAQLRKVLNRFENHIRRERRHVLTMAVICTATLAHADTFAERWPAPSAVDPVLVAQAQATKPHANVRRRAALGCHRIYFSRHRHRYWSCNR